MANYATYELYAKGHPIALQLLENCLPCVDIPLLDVYFDADGCQVIYHRCDCKNHLDCYCTSLSDTQLAPWDMDRLSPADAKRDDLLKKLRRMPMVQKSKVLQLKIQVHEWSRDSDFEKFNVYDCGKKLPVDEDPDFPWEDDVREIEEFKRECANSDEDDEILLERQEAFWNERLQPSRFDRIYWYKNKNNTSSKEWYAYTQLIAQEQMEWYQRRDNPPLWFKDDFPDYREFCEVFKINPKILKESMWEQIDENTYALKYESCGSQWAEITALVQMYSDKQESGVVKLPEIAAFAKMRSE